MQRWERECGRGRGGQGLERCYKGGRGSHRSMLLDSLIQLQYIIGMKCHSTAIYHPDDTILIFHSVSSSLLSLSLSLLSLLSYLKWK